MTSGGRPYVPPRAGQYAEPDPATTPPEGAEGQDGAPPSEAEVLAILAPVARRIADAIDRPGAGRAAIVEALRSDQGAVELLAAAFDSGKADAARTAVLRAPHTSPAGPPAAPDWSDVEAEGERRALAIEESICSACLHAPVCRGRPPIEMLVVVRRCIAFRTEGE